MVPNTPTGRACEYLRKEWQKVYTGLPPEDLMEGVVRVVMAVGYTRKLVDDILASWIKNKNKQEEVNGPN